MLDQPAPGRSVGIAVAFKREPSGPHVLPGLGQHTHREWSSRTAGR